MPFAFAEDDRLRYRVFLEDAWEEAIECASMVKYPQRNNYKALKHLAGRFGIYRFVDRTGDTLYVGAADIQDLPTRITQHLGPNDSGGTFRKNIETAKQWSKAETMEFLAGTRLLVIQVKPEDVLIFEAIATREYRPTYSGRTWRLRQRNEDNKGAGEDGDRE